MTVAHSSRAAIAGLSFNPFTTIGPTPGAQRRIVEAVSEVLERRLFKTAVTFSSGLISVSGTTDDEEIYVYDTGSGISVKNVDDTNHSLDNTWGPYAANTVTGISIIASSGNDLVVIGGSSNTQHGTTTPDFINGTGPVPLAVGIDGGAGNDTIYGGDYNDTINGGYGADSIYGDNGNDLNAIRLARNPAH